MTKKQTYKTPESVSKYIDDHQKELFADDKGTGKPLNEWYHDDKGEAFCRCDKCRKENEAHNG